jgi:hypothetical protein
LHGLVDKLSIEHGLVGRAGVDGCSLACSIDPLFDNQRCLSDHGAGNLITFHVETLVLFQSRALFLRKLFVQANGVIHVGMSKRAGGLARVLVALPEFH